MNIMIVLGAPNSDTGKLSEMATNRLDTARRFYMHNQDFYICCTGGFGPHFNKTATPHAQYAKQYLVDKGIPEERFLEYVLSSHTMEDALLAKPIIEKYTPGTIVVITSDFHMKRASLFFKHVFEHQNLIFVEAPSTLDMVTMEALMAHELQAIERFLAAP